MRGRLAWALLAVALVVAPVAAADTIHWRPSVAVGTPNNGALVRGVQLPSEGPDWFTWDLIRRHGPNRPWRRWGTDRLVRTLVTVLAQYRAAHPEAPRVGVADLSRPHGGWFGREFGGIGHASHQNGLDVDVLYPRRDHRERVASVSGQVEVRLSQDLVNRFTRVGARYVFVGPHLPLHGPRRRVQRLIYHDDHMHVRLPPSDR